MEQLVLDMKAAILYLAWRQLQLTYEGYTDASKANGDTDAQLYTLETELTELGYKNPRAVDFDKNNCPNINWKTQVFGGYGVSFNCLEFYLNIDNNINYFNI